MVIRVLTPLPFFHAQLVGIVNKLLNSTEPYADLMGRLLQSSKREHILAGLAVASAAVHIDEPDATNLLGGTARGRLAGKVWSSIVEGGSVKGFGRMLGMRRRNKEGTVEYGDKDPLDRPDIRHLAIDLILPLLPTTAFHVHAKAILSHLYSGLQADPATTVYRVLTAMWAAISGPPPGVARRIALVLLDESAIDNIAKVMDRNVEEPTTGRSVGEIAEGFLEGVTATHGRGICFEDEGWYPREEEESQDPRKKKGLHNRILSNVVKRLGARVVDGEGRVGAWVLKMFEACPELVAGYWAHSALSLDPRLDARWIATMAYVGRVVSLPIPDRKTFNQPAPRGVDAASMLPRAIPPAVATVVESVLPSPLTKHHLSKGLQHNNALVQHVTALALARGLQKLAAVQALFAAIGTEVDEGADGAWAARARELEIECRRRVPEVPVIIAFAQKAAQLARPTDEDDEVEPALAARGAMLTEAALRLFGLYHKTLPSLAGEARFDIGKLLVSASSANAERRARREAREGSVVSDSGSVGSVGTLGTVGMGGGFGHSRGDVEGFEALSQLHVLRLLSEVRDWTWTNKAAGSQFTYLYHILQLHLSTRNVVTHVMTTTLLHRLLGPSLLFEHDALELPIWLEAFPCVSDTVNGPMFIAQQIHLLSFVDECTRRTLKTPHRYIEDAATVVPTLSAQAVASPLLLTMVEQLHAKLLGMHIATDAAASVLNYLRRVLVSLLGKQATADFVREIITRLRATIKAAHEAGQPRHGLMEIVSLMDSDLAVVFEAGKLATVDPETPKLVDEADWIQRSFIRQALESFSTGTLAPTLVMLMNTATTDEGARQAQFLVHLLAASRPKDDVLRLLALAVGKATDDTQSRRLKTAVFNNSAVRDLFLTSAGDDVREQLTALAATLKEATFDRALAEHYAHTAVETLENKKTPDALAFAAVAPWIRFLTPAQVDASLSRTLKRAKKSSSTPSDVLGALVLAARAESVYPHLSALLARGCYRPVSTRLQAAVATSLSRRLNVELTASIVSDLIKADDDAHVLLALLVSLSSDAAKVFAAELEKNPEWLDDARVLPSLVASQSPVSAVATKAAAAALSNVVLSDEIHTAAAQLLVSGQADDVNAALGAIPLASFNLPLARAASSLAASGNADVGWAVTSLLNLGLQWSTRVFSSDTPLAGDELATLAALSAAIKDGESIRVEPNTAFAEPAITAAVTDRLDVAEALEFAAILVQKSMMKAGFVRAQLQQLVASKQITKLALPSAEPEHRLAFIRLTHALFLASTYVSCQPNFVEPLVPLYRGTLSLADRLLLQLFQAFETQRKVSMTSVLKHWSPGGGVSSRALDAVTSFDAQRVFGTCCAFPLRRSFVAGPGDADETEDVYDPVFVLGLTAAALQEELSGLDFVEILRSNVLGLAVCALSSRDKGMRAVAGYVLSAALNKMATVGFHEKLQLVHTLELLAHAIPAPQKEAAPTGADAFNVDLTPKQPRVPTLIALFIAHALRALAHPAHFLYPISSRFLLQRPTLDSGDVPALYGMLYAAGDGSRRERTWMVRLLRDGVKSDADYRILARRNTFALLASLFQSSQDAVFRRNVLGAVTSIARVPAGGRALLRNSLVAWIAAQWDAALTRPQTEEVRDLLLTVLEDALASVGADEAQRWAKDAARFVAATSATADAARLEVLARIALRLAPATVASLPALVARLGALGASSEGAQTAELLFRASLYIPDGPVSPDMAVAVNALAARVAAMDGGVGAWARAEARRV